MDDDKKDSSDSNFDDKKDMTDVESPVEPDTLTPQASSGGSPSYAVLNDATQPSEPTPVKKESRFKRFLHTKKGKFFSILIILLAIVGVLFAIPSTRYGILGLVLKKEAKLIVIDAQTKKPVTQAQVELGSLSAKTDIEGKVDFKDVPVGEYNAKVTKKNYKDMSVSYAVPIFTASEESTINLEATGRQVVITLTNIITKSPVKDATIAVDEATAVTDDEGKATLVLPADKEVVKAKVTHNDYNAADADITITDQTDKNVVAITPAGNVYYLSKATGKIDVMKANLDGSAATVVVAATGNEIDTTTSLLAARDWQYMVLSAKRKSNVAGQLYVIDAKTNSLKSVDEGDVSIRLVGWSGHDFLYIVTRNDKQSWQEKYQALKSYNAETGKISVIDETMATGTGYVNAEYELIDSPYIIEGKIAYAKNVQRGAGAAHAMKSAIMVATIGNSQTQRLKEFDFTQHADIDAKLYEPQEVYFRVSIDNKSPEFYEYEASGIKSVTNDDNKFYNTYYPTFLVSPDGQKTLWDEPRNGKNAIFIGDKNGSNSTEIAQQSEYGTYGWYSDKYILLTKGGSELSIASASQPLAVPLKITNYHKPAVNFEGYGYGYGGL